MTNPLQIIAEPDHEDSEAPGALWLNLTGTFDIQTLHHVAAAISECLLNAQLIYW